MIDRFAPRPHSAARALLAALLALVLSGCGADPSRVLARVGDRTITVDDFVEVARDKQDQYAEPPDSAKALLLGDLVQAGDHGIRFLLVSGTPIEEPVAWYGPIVMNTEAELRQAYAELRAGTFTKK